MNAETWAALPVETRRAVDAHIRLDRRLMAVKVLRDALPEESRQGLYDTLDMVNERFRELGVRREPGHTEPLDPAALADRAAQLPGRPAAVEALWDGDTFGWMVDLVLVTDEPEGEHPLAVIRHGGDIRLFNGTVPPWPEAEEARRAGHDLAERLGVPFHFASPDRPDEEAPRWRDLQSGAPS
ncbi:hypothetical protein ABZ957_26305 [Streptomyces sp. NPDC046316]|uniref:hypothetical protein n=1 Tax=Streptomyces sp. NPDC046316 TaxID=3154494 RepID=UPI0033FDB6A6